MLPALTPPSTSSSSSNEESSIELPGASWATPPDDRSRTTLSEMFPRPPSQPSSEFYPGRNPMSSAFQAELGMLRALRKNRKEFGKKDKSMSRKRGPAPVPWLSEEENLLKQLRSVDYLSMSKDQLKRFRRGSRDNPSGHAAASAEQEKNNEIAAVRALTIDIDSGEEHREPPTPDTQEGGSDIASAISTENQSNNSRLKATRKSRQKRHDGALELFRDTVVNISEELEAQVINQGRDLRDDLTEFDQQLKAKMDEIRQDDFLRKQEYDYVVESWDELEQVCEDRKKVIQDFKKTMGNLETQRAERVGEQLKDLVDELVMVGYFLGPELHRLVETEAHEVNLVIIANLTALADLEARMLRRQVDVYFSTRSEWENRETRWRLLRHDRALDEWAELLSSKRFTNPPDRVDAIGDAVKQQRQRHVHRRLAALDRLRQVLPPDNLDSKTIKQINEELVALNEDEESKEREFEQRLLELEDQTIKDMETQRERLRHELHSYSALADQGDLYTSGLRGEGANHRESLEKMISDPELEEFFRRGTGLKTELVAINTELGLSHLIYSDRLSALHARVVVVVEASKLEGLVHAQGKMEDKRQLEATLEKLRTAKKAQLAPLIPIFFKYTRSISNVKGLHPSVVAELQEGMAILQNVQPGLLLNIHSTFDDLKSVASKSSRRSGNSQASPTGIPNVASMISEPGYKEKPVNLSELRSAQRKIGALINASNLHEEFKKELRALSVSLERQKVANQLIDAVVEERCSEPIAQRASEMVIIREHLSDFLRNQLQRLYHHTLQVCQFYARVTVVVNRAADGNTQTDLRIDRALDKQFDDFDTADAEYEAEFSRVGEAIRHAPDEKALAVGMEKAMGILDDIKQAYRNYHTGGISLARQHPARAFDEARAFRYQICGLFGLDEIEPVLGDDVMQNDDDDDNGKECGENNNTNVIVAAATQAFQGTIVTQENRETEEDGDDAIVERSGPLVHKAKCGTLYRVQYTPEELAARLLGMGDKDESSCGDTNSEPDTVASPENSPSQIVLPEEGAVVQSEDSTTVLDSVIDPPNTGVQDGVNEQIDQEKLPGGEVQPRTLKNEAILDTAEQVNQPDAHKLVVKENTNQLVMDHSHIGALADQLAVAAVAPTDEDGNDLVAALSIDVSLVSEMLTLLRQSLFDCVDEQQMNRAEEMDLICIERCDAFTHELEERLRLHWPRKGRTDVKVQQPRYGELLSHRQRHDRHVRSVKLKSKAQETRFVKCVSDANKRTELFHERLAVLSRHLERQGSLAALQGIYKRGKECLMSFRKEIRQTREVMRSFVAEEPESLLDMNKVFLESCTTFSDGGDYNEEEVQLEKAALENVDTNVKENTAKRAELVRETVQQQKEGQLDFKQFHDDYERCLQSLSMREGLGQKYGIPRRNAQEKLRGEIVRSDAAAAHIDKLVNTLTKLTEGKATLEPHDCLVTATGEVVLAVPEVPDENQSKDNESIDQENRAKRQVRAVESLAEQIQCVVDSLRKCLYRRAQYLNFLRSESIAECDFEKQVHVYCGPTWPTEPGTADSYAALLARPSAVAVVMGARDVSWAMGADESTKFTEVIAHADQKCREETVALYTREGRQSELGPQGIPDSLQNFLEDVKDKAGKYRDTAAAILREQIRKVEKMLEISPSVAFKDVSMCAVASAALRRQGCASGLEVVVSRCESSKEMHRSLLRPRLGEPDSAEELQSLCTRERRRTQELNSAVQAARYESLIGEEQAAKVFESTLLGTAEALVDMMRTMVMCVDLQVLPGDDLIPIKRKNLKKLTRLHDKRLRKKNADNVDLQADDDDEDVVRFNAWTVPGIQLVDVSHGKYVGNNADDGDKQDEDSGTKDGGVNSACTTNALFSIATPQMRALVKGRAGVYGGFMDMYKDRIQGVDLSFEQRRNLNLKWEDAWTQLVCFLVEDGGSKEIENNTIDEIGQTMAN